MRLQDDVDSVSLKRVLGNCHVCHSKQQSVLELVEHGEGGEGGEEQTERIKLKRSLFGCCKPGKNSPKSYNVGGKVRYCREIFLFQRQMQSIYLCTRHHPVEDSLRNDDVSRGQMQGVCEGIREGKAICLAYTIKNSQQKEAEQVNHAAVLSVASLKASRAAGLAPAARAAGSRTFGLARNTPPGGLLRRAQIASSHTPNRKPKVSRSANTPRAARFECESPRHQICS